MKLIYTRIDPNDHNKQFWILFGIDSATKQYYGKTEEKPLDNIIYYFKKMERFLYSRINSSLFV